MFTKYLQLSKVVYTFAKNHTVECGKGSKLLTNDNKCQQLTTKLNTEYYEEVYQDQQRST